MRDRQIRGLVNQMPDDTGRSFVRIFTTNVLTVFNAIVGGSFLLLLALGAWQDALFGVFVVANTMIGVGQEFRAKRILSRLSVLTAPRALVHRENADVECAVADVVLDDILVLLPGAQIVADTIVVESHELEVDESLLTGESDPIVAPIGHELLSGSLIVAGSGLARVIRVGADAYAARITSEARQFALVNSELRRSIGQVIRWLSLLLIPISVVVVNGQMQAAGGWAAALSGTGWRDVAVASTASVIAMVPAGLVFISSVALAVGAVRLARHGVLVRELAAVEGLARVDMLCIDKTGTLTEGAMALDRVDLIGRPPPGWECALGWLAHDPAANATARAIAERFTNTGEPPVRAVPFASRHKWSAVSFAAGAPAGTWVLGGADVILAQSPQTAGTHAAAETIAETGARTLVIAKSAHPISEAEGIDPILPEGLEPVALIILRERVRADAARIVRYFQEQGVEVCVLSGDEPRTVAAIARAAGLSAELRSVDARTLPLEPAALTEALRDARVFGRVTPEQKKAMILALKSSGHTVAMVGDGVNDALALKHADLGIAIGTGSGAARGVAHVVLLDGGFAHLPQVVAEGRRVIANVERLARVFLTKTVYAIVLGVAFGLLLVPFPFLPRQLSIVDGLTIGLPALVLGFLPNSSAYRPGFLTRTVRFCVPSGLIVAAAVFTVVAVATRVNLPQGQVQAAATITLTLSALWVLVILARPLTRLTAILVGSALLGLGIVLLVPVSRRFLVLELPPAEIAATALVAAGVASGLLELVHRLARPVRG